MTDTTTATPTREECLRMIEAALAMLTTALAALAQESRSSR